MRVACLGGGPAGFYFAISLKLRMPQAQIDIFERNRSGDTFGWGVVFSDQTLANLAANDPISAQTISDSFAHWDDIKVHLRDVSMTSRGHGFIGIGRKRLLQILQTRAVALGVNAYFESEFGADLSEYADYDLIVAADGINSAIRTRYADRFGVDIKGGRNKFIWLGTTKLFNAFEFLFEETRAGWIWAHAYRFDETHSTFIVECAPETWAKYGFEGMSSEETLAACEKIFARHLDGHRLISNAGHLRGSAAWIEFRRVLCMRWSFDNVVLLGDAAHTAHFSIGSGTKLALEDAIKLADVIKRTNVHDRSSLLAALSEYEQQRHVEVLKLQNSARNSTEWFETVDRYINFDLPQFTYSLLTRSQRVSHENLRLRDREWLHGIEEWLWRRAGGAPGIAGQPIFAPLQLREMHLSNRIVVAPVLTYAAGEDGVASDFHTVHYGARALGGAGLIVSEALAVEPEGRMTPACPGLYSDSQIDGWRHINNFIHQHSEARTCAQLGHAGPRASCRIPLSSRDFDKPLDECWPIISASPRPWKTGGLLPVALSEAGMDRIVESFADAARRADQAGFDMIEIQLGHGGLLSSFITPVMNQRTDAFGGVLENRLRFPLRVIAAVRAVWPAGKPLAARISATDWTKEGLTPAESVEIARRLKAAGIDLVDVSAGETDPAAKPIYGRMFLTPFSDRIRNEAQIPTIAVGAITDPDQANSILAAGRADLVALGRPHLVNPAWTLKAAASAGYDKIDMPLVYKIGWDQLSRQSGRAENIQA